MQLVVSRLKNVLTLFPTPPLITISSDRSSVDGRRDSHVQLIKANTEAVHTYSFYGVFFSRTQTINTQLTDLVNMMVN